MKKQIKNLSLHELDFIVAKAENLDDPRIKNFGALIKVDGEFSIYSPTTNPLQAWPIIEREMISTIYIDYYTKWMAESEKHSGFGETSLESAMRAYVASKFGDEVDIDNLTNK
jgi:hypothetical protein